MVQELPGVGVGGISGYYSKLGSFDVGLGEMCEGKVETSRQLK